LELSVKILGRFLIFGRLYSEVDVMHVLETSLGRKLRKIIGKCPRKKLGKDEQSGNFLGKILGKTKVRIFEGMNLVLGRKTA